MRYNCGSWPGHSDRAPGGWWCRCWTRCLSVRYIFVGTNKGRRIFLPRIPHHNRHDELPFVRRPLPVRLAFSVTVNKGQGQENEGVWHLKVSSVLTYHQLYSGIFRRQWDSGTAAAYSNECIHTAQQCECMSDEEGITEHRAAVIIFP